MLKRLNEFGIVALIKLAFAKKTSTDTYLTDSQHLRVTLKEIILEKFTVDTEGNIYMNVLFVHSSPTTRPLRMALEIFPQSGSRNFKDEESYLQHLYEVSLEWAKKFFLVDSEVPFRTFYPKSKMLIFKKDATELAYLIKKSTY